MDRGASGSSGFGRWLMTRLRREGRSEADLARTLGISRQAVRKWREGWAYPRPERVRALARWLGVPPRWLHALILADRIRRARRQRN
jgi:transcriptional regulator with XRE-family HTH domain